MSQAIPSFCADCNEVDSTGGETCSVCRGTLCETCTDHLRSEAGIVTCTRCTNDVADAAGEGPMLDRDEIPLWFRTPRKTEVKRQAPGAPAEDEVTAWLEPEEFEPDPTQPALYVYVRLEEPSHGGYCSDVYGREDLEDVEYTARTVVRAFRADTWIAADFRPAKFRYLNGCLTGGGASGYCDLPTRVKITSILNYKP